MTPLGCLIARRIAATGPMTLADYMAECLLHPEHGYYTTRPPFGAEGDFITAPEISQMFGELLGLALAQAWLDQGAPAPFTLAELGPGRGTLMADLLRATRAIPGFHAAAQITLVEASPRLRAVQLETVRRQTGQALRWQDTVADLPDQPLFLIANEFFDALPIRQFQRSAQGWRERLVGLQGGALAFGLSDPIGQGPILTDPRFADEAPGTLVEICPLAPMIVTELCQRLRRHGGLALVLDYGGWHSRGDTFQALAGHRPVDPLAAPGLADLTAHVDFEALAQAATGMETRYTPQGALLTRLGIGPRTERLAQGLAGSALENHLAAARRLTHPSEMGELFKALALFRPGAPTPPGFG
ncbi:class I SAM-dependent methyltransferase [Xinfangfangia pollutisoli]|uniref:class I SAM-dependent methyltransferase n=1 Tax=Xinfangfangia pollutisoli TaxID=2865960 RepID=UPI001CD32A46|nr:SAM-dependent methyltransferase [Xinfangfangia pollutisoli]